METCQSYTQLTSQAMLSTWTLSLTPCLDKLFEKVILTRLNKHLHDKSISLHPSWFLATKIISLPRTVYYNNSKNCWTSHTTGIVLVHDLSEVLNNVVHDDILQNLENTSCGQKMYVQLITSFLQNCSAN